MSDYAKATMTLNLSRREMDALDEIAKECDMSKTAVIKQALRVYQMTRLKAKQGLNMCFRDKDGKVEAPILMLSMPPN